MSTLPFLLSVADELDNLNSQSYMDDFGLGFHPHRQFYRTPTIQLSLPPGTDWMQQDTGRHHGPSSRYRSYRCYTDNHLPSTNETVIDENLDNDNNDNDDDNDDDDDNRDRCNRRNAASTSSSTSTSALASAKRAQKFVSALKSSIHIDDDIDIDDRDINYHNRIQDDENIMDNSAGTSSLSKKCGKNYYRHNKSSVSSSISSSSAGGTGGTGGGCSGPGATSSVTTITTTTATTRGTSTPLIRSRCDGDRSTANKATKGGMSYRLHSKCLEGNNSSSEESLQKVTSSIEFLTCFLLKKSRASNKESPTTSTTTTNTPSSRHAADNRKS